AGGVLPGGAGLPRQGAAPEAVARGDEAVGQGRRVVAGVPEGVTPTGDEAPTRCPRDDAAGAEGIVGPGQGRAAGAAGAGRSRPDVADVRPNGAVRRGA